MSAEVIPGGAPYQPWAADLVKQRMADNSKDNPDAHCLPLGIAQMNAHPFPRKIIQTPTEVILIYEGSGTTVREIYLDGRACRRIRSPGTTAIRSAIGRETRWSSKPPV